MKVDLAQKIGGLTLGDVRALFRKLNRNEMTFAMIGDGLCVIGRPLSRQAQRKLIDALIGAGYLKVNGEHDGQTVFQVTGLAFRLAASPTTNRFDRRTADRLVAELLDRVRTLNADAHNPVCAARVRAFGSYITEEDTLGDIDLVVELTTRYGANLGDELAHAKQFGPPARGLVGLAAACKNGALLKLRARQTRLSFHDADELSALGCPYKTLFQAKRSDILHYIRHPELAPSDLERHAYDVFALENHRIALFTPLADRHA